MRFDAKILPVVFIWLTVMFTSAHAQSSAPVFFVSGGSYSTGAFGVRGDADAGYFVPPATLAVGDFNLDGIPDLVVANFCNDGPTSDICNVGASVSVLMGNGDGTFYPAAKYVIGDTALSVVVGDFNLDGKPDIAVGHKQWWPTNDPGLVSVLLGNGNGSFQNPVTYRSGGGDAVWLGVADLNSDNRPDLVDYYTGFDSVGQVIRGIGFLAANGDGTFLSPTTSRADLFMRAATLGNFDGDHLPDLAAVANCYVEPGHFYCNTGLVEYLKGNGDGTFAGPVSHTTGTFAPRAVATGDFNGDGKSDLAVLENRITFGKSWVSVELGNGDGTFQPGTHFAAGGYLASSLAVGDFNRDGIADIAVTNRCSTASDCANSVLSILLGEGDGAFKPPVNFATSGKMAEAVVVQDFDGDGNPDIGVAYQCAEVSNCTTKSVSVHLNRPGHITNIDLAPSLNPVLVGQPTTFTATVTAKDGSTPGGSVTFKQGNGVVLGTVALSGGQATLTHPFPATAYAWVLAYYLGEPGYATSSSAKVVEVIKKVPTVTTLTSSANPSAFGKPVTFTATATATYGTLPDGGIVNFLEGTTLLGTGIVNAGTARFTTSLLASGTHKVRASFVATPTYVASTSMAVTQVVAP